MIATGYAFVRPDALTPIVDPVSFDVLPLKNKISFSKDLGESWSVPNVFNVLDKPLEISGPCIQLATGRILAACPPFHLGETGHSGWIIYSDDNGKSWNKLSDFFNSPNGEIAAWECRLCEIDNNGVAVMIDATHNCVSCRGVKHGGASMKTSKLTGAFKDDTSTRAEFYEFVKGY